MEELFFLNFSGSHGLEYNGIGNSNTRNGRIYLDGVNIRDSFNNVSSVPSSSSSSSSSSSVVSFSSRKRMKDDEKKLRKMKLFHPIKRQARLKEMKSHVVFAWTTESTFVWIHVAISFCALIVPRRFTKKKKREIARHAMQSLKRFRLHFCKKRRFLVLCKTLRGNPNIGTLRGKCFFFTFKRILFFQHLKKIQYRNHVCSHDRPRPSTSLAPIW